MAEYIFQYAKAKTKATIGDAVSFKPKAKLAKWDDAHSFALEVEGLGLFTPTVDSITGKIDGKAIDKDFNISYRQTPVNPAFNQEGGLDIVITMGKVALSNVINFIYSNDHVAGYLQPPLTQEFTTGWSERFQCNIAVTETDVIDSATGRRLVHRPDYVVNSIAFFATDQGGIQRAGGIEWETGKVGHLYRMKASSFDGKVDPVWCDWSISGQVVALTIPFAWWSDTKTKFPITIAPVGDTFGVLAAGGAEVDLEDYQYMGRCAPAGGDGDGVSITTWLRCTTDAKLARCNIYDDGAGIADETVNIFLNGETEEKLVPVQALLPVTFDFLVPPAFLNGVFYRPVAWGDGGNGELFITYDVVGGESMYFVSINYTVNPWGDPQTYTRMDGFRLAIYVTYTTGGGGGGIADKSANMGGKMIGAGLI